MKIIGLDCATRTGWAVLESDGMTHELLSSGWEEFRSRKKRIQAGELYAAFGTFLDELIRDEMPAALAYEMPHQRGGEATRKLINLTGRVEELGYQHDIPVYSIHSGTIKRLATGNGHACKDEMILAASRIAGHQIKSDDEADAIMTAVACARLIKEGKK